MNHVGMIGLGTMGAPMARNLMKAGYPLVFFARRPEVITEFEKAGAIFAESPAAVTANSDFVISIVTADQALEEVALGENGIAAAAKPGKMLLEMSTVNPATTVKVGHVLRERGMSMLDAPVSGGPNGARNATLSIMVGGNDDHLKRARPILETLGEKIYYCGPLGAGQTIKVVNQMMAGGIMALIGEGFALAKAAGADLQCFADVVSASSGGSTMFNARKQFVLDDRYEPAFRTELMRKDVGLALELAKHLNVPLPLASAAFQQYTAAVRSGLGDLDFASIAKYCLDSEPLMNADKR